MEIGPFVVVSELGRGAMGVVYQARDKRTGANVALKVLRDVRDEADQKRFLREVEAMAAVAHPNVVRIVGWGSNDGLPWVALELLRGGSLHDELKRLGKMGWRRAAEVGAAVARGLAAVHAAGFVHRDLKPANVLLDEARTPKLADFGLVRPLDPSRSRLTETSFVVGTPSFIAPEQAADRPIDGRADLYSLGALLYALVTGAPPFTGSSADVLKAHIRDKPKAPGASAELDALILRLLEKDPARRGPGAAAVAEELDRIAKLTKRRASRGPLVLGLVAAFAGGAVAQRMLGEPRTILVPAPPPPPAPPPAPPRAPAALLPIAHGELVNVKDGSLLVRVDAGPSETGYLPAYYLGKYEVTVAQFRRFVDETHFVTTADRIGGFVYEPPSKWRVEPRATWRNPTGHDDKLDPDEPVVQVSWEDAKAYVAWAGLRLATDAEWSKAGAWDGKKQAPTHFAWGDELPRKDRARANLRDDSFYDAFPLALTGERKKPGFDDRSPRQSPVGHHPSGVSWTGAQDLTGNVWEWVEDLSPKAPSKRLLRGGSWYDEVDSLVETQQRMAQKPEDRAENMGFRVARD